MTDDNTSLGGLAMPANPEPVEEPVAIPDTVEVQTEAPAQEPIPDELEDFEWEGKQVKLPKGMKDGYLRQDDYTRKTQATAERNRELDERAAQLDQQSQATEDDLTNRAHLHHINSELKKFEHLTWQQWQAWKNQDPVAAEEGWQYYQLLKDQKTGVDGKIKEAEAKRSEAFETDVRKRFQEAGQWAKKEIKGWTPDLDKKVLEFAGNEGMSEAEVVRYMSPRFYNLLHKAMVGAAALTRAQTAPPNPPQTQPLQTVGAKSNPSSHKALAEMDMDEYAAARKAGRKG